MWVITNPYKTYKNHDKNKKPLGFDNKNQTTE